jgi:CRISPR-associated protein Csy3
MAKKDTVSVLAFEKKLVPSDGYLYGTTWGDRNDNSTPLSLIEKSVRGTISNRLSSKLKMDPAKLDAEVEKPNLQTVDSCSLLAGQDTLKLSFTLKILSGVEEPSACNHAEFHQSYSAVAKKYIETHGFKQLAQRYAVNIANGRFFWRNRVGAEKLEVRVRTLLDEDMFDETFNAKDIGIQNFESTSPALSALSERISDALSGKKEFALFQIDAFALVGKAQEVYPSEELVMDKGKGKKSKILYSVKGVAAMHSQKIGNALRTIDTWYPDYSETKRPIAIEPYGAVTNLGVAYRNPSNKTDFYSLFDKYARGEELAVSEQEHYVMAVLVRGGVFGESDK